ncbi:Ubiquitin carboxyl-terminal hydrolase 16 [Oryzias melastigma]|uniref:Ubiquitin carboxyl-terminal hydrolase 16 n=1 Tax=Oryzias melastigma TaxID=30732 RepID=A0A834C920_ORYME|nr:Ubiquitin carboxyl-terminal hydrolase 16 [Oryzias melastigma]
MGKKRGKDRSSRGDEDDFELTVPSCRHIKTGADQSLLKKLSGISDWTNCQDCKHEENKENDNTTLQQDSEEEKEPAGIWMCLKCGHRGCGRNSENQHAIKHYETPRSSPHCLVISLDNWSVWCYICDDDVQYSRTGHLAQLVTNIKKQSGADPVKRPEKKVKDEASVLEAKENSETANTENKSENKENSSNKNKNIMKERAEKTQNCITTEGNVVIPVKGLSNLGNTCFFNAVIQNLSQTQLLRETLNKVTGEKLNLDIKPASLDLEPIVVTLEQPGSLTLAMCHLLNEIQLSKKGVVTPRELFTQVCKKAPRFKGFQQQDSQELLRYLLDGMRAEEQKRVNAGIMEALKLANEDADGDQLKTVAKEYEKNRLPRNFVDQVFGGEMTSTIMCQQCKTVSVVTEMFLDLSLPVVDEAYRKKNQRKGAQKNSESSQDGQSSPAPTSRNDDGDVPTAGSSKYQQKKAKKQAKKQAKQQKRQQKLDSRVTLDSLTDNTENEQTNADVDAEETANDEEQEEPSASDPNPDATSVSEQDKSVEPEEDSLTTSSSATNRFTVLSDEQHSQERILNDEMSNEEEDDAQLVNEMEKVTLDEAFIEDSEAADQNMESEDEVLDAKEYTVVNQDPELAFSTLATRTAPEKQECSVQSCLFQFTEVETLTLTNSLLCVTCTKQQQKKNRSDGPKKNVYTDALKQMLISSPPAVLTLHLKRFQQNGYTICKVNRFVHFPLILDLAPYCAAKCKDNINDSSNKEETGVLYSLYGVVEHSGTMRSGHYTAYVKVRPNRSKTLSNGLSAEEPSTGSWFHISDTSVQPVSESKVQSCQAYLLFYERVL